MRRKRLSPTDPNEWLRRARSNLARAKNRIPEACLEDLCFDAQQAAEKAIKAVFIHRGLAFPFTHDLARLLTRLRRPGFKIPKYLGSAKRLTPFAVEARYPGLSSPVSEKQYRGAVRIAEAVLRWAARHIVGRSP
jgi:HEPN domain-containing protein